MSPPADWNPHGEAELADPVAAHARLRRECPVAGSTQWGGFYTLTRHADVLAASKDAKTFTATKQTVIPSSPRKGLPRLPLQKDPPESARYRQGLALFFKESRVAGMEAPLRARAEQLAQVLATGDVPDFGETYAGPFTVETLCLLVGMDLSEGTELGRLSHDYVAAVQREDLSTAGEISRRVDTFAIQLVEDRNATPRDREADMVSGLKAFSPQGGPYDDTELAGMVRLLLIGGHVVPRNFLCSTAWHLCQDQDLQARLRAGKVDLKPLIEELLRVYSPNQALVRVTTCDTEIGGTAIPEGCPVALNYLSANRDEAVFDEPMRFDEGRHPNRHIAFGFGTHACIGQSLARLQTRVTLETLAALPPFAAAEPPGWARWTEYGVNRLHLEFDPR